MKGNRFLSTFLPVAAILAVIFLAFFLFLEKITNPPDAPASPAEPETSALEEASLETEEASASPSGSSLGTDHCFIWVGDSRTAGMEEAMEDRKDSCLYIAAPGEGYDWFVSQGLPALLYEMELHPQAPVIFNLGVNDYDNLELYLALYEDLLTEYPDTPFFFLSVNPIDPAQCETITNEEIGIFNSRLKELKEDAYLDSYTYLMANEIATIDGIHYSQETYRLIHDYAGKAVLDSLG